MRYTNALALLASVLLSGCIFDYHEERLSGPYSLVSIDTEDQLVICYRLSGHGCEDRITATVIKAGANERYIDGSRRDYSPGQHRLVGPQQFFYLDRKLDGPSAPASASVRGPFNQAEFAALAARLDLPPMHAVHG